MLSEGDNLDAVIPRARCESPVAAALAAIAEAEKVPVTAIVRAAVKSYIVDYRLKKGLPVFTTKEDLKAFIDYLPEDYLRTLQEAEGVYRSAKRGNTGQTSK